MDRPPRISLARGRGGSAERRVDAVAQGTQVVARLLAHAASATVAHLRRDPA
jgi:hypothetical protein